MAREGPRGGKRQRQEKQPRGAAEKREQGGRRRGGGGEDGEAHFEALVSAYKQKLGAGGGGMQQWTI